MTEIRNSLPGDTKASMRAYREGWDQVFGFRVCYDEAVSRDAALLEKGGELVATIVNLGPQVQP